MNLFAAPSKVEIQQRRKSRQKTCKHLYNEYEIKGKEDFSNSHLPILHPSRYAVVAVHVKCSDCGLRRYPLPIEEWYNVLPVTVSIHPDVNPRPYIVCLPANG